MGGGRGGEGGGVEGKGAGRRRDRESGPPDLKWSKSVALPLVLTD